MREKRPRLARLQLWSNVTDEVPSRAQIAAAGLAICRTALAAGLVPKPLASARRLIVLRQDLPLSQLVLKNKKSLPQNRSDF